MAEKEEKIEKFITIQQRTITTRDYETNDEIISKFYPRQEAIERMAKAFCETGAPNTWGLVERDYKRFCLAGAEAALNSLLEGK